MATINVSTRPLPLSSQSVTRHCTTYYYSYLSRTRTAAVCDMSLLMREIDGSRGEDYPARVKRTRRVFRPTYKASSACALRCPFAANLCECVCTTWLSDRVGLFFARILSKKICKFGVRYTGRLSDAARLILPSENQAHFLFRIRYYYRRLPYYVFPDLLTKGSSNFCVIRTLATFLTTTM